jgi:hypothetical protein
MMNTKCISNNICVLEDISEEFSTRVLLLYLINDKF